MRLRLLIAATLTVVASLAVPVAAAAAADCTGLPKHNNLPVVDAAGVLDPQKRAFLTGDLVRFKMTADVAVVAATVPTLNGDDVSSYARRLFDCWGIGDADSDRGVLILAAMRERRLRVELGSGLAGEIGETELQGAVNAMSAPMRAGNVAGALRAAAVQIAGALGEELPDLERFVATNGTEGLGDLGIPESIVDPTVQPGAFGDDVPVRDSPFAPLPTGDGSWIPKVAIPVVVIGIIVTIGRAVFRGVTGVGGSTWRGGFPTFGGSRSGWDDPNLLNNGQWSQGTFMGGSSPSSSSSSSSSLSSAGSSGGGGGSFGGGSAGGGGASGSW